MIFRVNVSREATPQRNASMRSYQPVISRISSSAADCDPIERINRTAVNSGGERKF